MRKIKVLFIGLLFTLLLVLGINSYASVNVEVSLKQQESNDHNNSVRYVGTITGLDYSEIKNYSVSISMYDTNGTLSKSNTKTYTTLYDKVVGVSTVAQDKVYYAVFTLTDLSSYTGYKLDCSFTFNLENGDKYTTNHKYFEIGTKYAINATSYAGYDEGCFMEFDPYNSDTNPSNYVAEYRNLDSSTWTYNTIDNELIRYTDGKFRVDMVGLSEGNYTLRVSKGINGVKYVTDEVVVTVSKTDRSGYAHFNYSEGVGAYNNNGTLKSGAVVVYVNDSNKNTVTATISGKTYTGLGDILANASKFSVPLDIRFLDVIKTTQWNKITYTSAAKSSALIAEQMATVGNTTNDKTYEAAIISNGWNSYSDDEAKGITKLNGLTSYFTYGTQDASATGYEYDSCWNMMNVSGGNNITVEGIGTSAGLFQWGFTWKNCKSIEVKNLTFDDYTEDACSFEASKVTAEKTDTSKDLSVLSYGYSWVHNCTFEEGVNNWDLSCEKDKGDGDGSTDIKYVRNVTVSYTKYVNTHKTGLVGGSENHLSANITFHHNYYEGCKSRMPFARQANMHMYNNYYSNSTGTTMQIYAGAYAFIENCYFENDNKTFDVQSKSYATPAVKSYNNVFDGSKTYSVNGVTHVTDRTTTVSNGNLFNQTFDTDSSFFYYDSVNKRSNVENMETAEEAKVSVLKLAGVLSSGHYNNVVENTTPPTVDPSETYTVTFNNDGSITTATVTSGEKVAEPTAPTKSGYTFDGWYLNDAKYDFNTAVTSNITLVAKWTENASTEATTVIYYFDGTVATSPNYSFTSTIQSSSTTLGDLSIDATGTSAKLAFDSSKNHTQWNQNTIITFNAVAGTKITVVSVPNYNHYTVDGVASSANTETFTISTSKVVTLVATSTAYIYRIEIETPGSSTAETYSVTYNINGHGTAPSNLTGQTNLPTTLPVLTESGYTFGGWYLDEALTEKAVAGATLSSNVVLYAKWTANTVVDGLSSTKYYSFNPNFDSAENVVILDSGWDASKDNYVIDGLTLSKCKDNGSHNWLVFSSSSSITFDIAKGCIIKVAYYDSSSLSNTTIKLNGETLTTSDSFTNNTTYINYNATSAGTVDISFSGNGYLGAIGVDDFQSDSIPSSMELKLNTISKASNTSNGNQVYYNNNFKQVYNVGDSLDKTGIYGVVTYTNDTTKTILSSALDFSGFSSTTSGAKTITVSYTVNGTTVSDTYTVYVVSTSPSVVDNVTQVKVQSSYTGTIGDVVDGYNMFTTINQALDYLESNTSSSDKKLIYVAAGTYNEKLEITLPNLTIRGENKTSTVIEYNSLYGLDEADGFRHVTDSTMTVAIREAATNCIIENITISNYYNHIDRFSGVKTYNDKGVLTDRTGDGERGLALLVQADMFIMNGCRLLGWQDTLETFTGRQYFYNTYICGSVDFIFGTNSTTYFQNCQIEAIKGKTSASSSSTAAYVTAYKGLNKGSSDAVTYGAIFDGCNFTTASDFIGKVALARPWTQYSAVAVLNSTLSSEYLTAASKTIVTGLAYVYGSTTTKISSWANIDTLKFKVYNNSSAITDDITGVTTNLDSTAAANYSDFSVIFGKTNGGVTYSSAWNPTKYDGSTGDSGSSSTGEKIVHNFTTDGKNSSVFTINGNLSKDKGTVTYDGLTLTQCLKMESSTSITFTLDTTKTIKLVFIEKTGNVKIDGISYSVNENGIVSTTLSSGSHTITKGDSINLFYIVLE